MKITDLSSFNSQIDIEVYWADMDAARHVNNVKYLNWTESARIDYFMKADMSLAFDADHIGPIIAWQDCKYIFPMTFPDTAQIGIRVSEILEDRIIMEAAVFSKTHNRIAAISKQILIPYDYGKLEKSIIPRQWITEIEKIEERTFS